MKVDKIQEKVREWLEGDNNLWNEGQNLLRLALEYPYTDDEGWKELAEHAGDLTVEEVVQDLFGKIGHSDTPGDWFEFAEGMNWGLFDREPHEPGEGNIQVREKDGDKLKDAMADILDEVYRDMELVQPEPNWLGWAQQMDTATLAEILIILRDDYSCQHYVAQRGLI